MSGKLFKDRIVKTEYPTLISELLAAAETGDEALKGLLLPPWPELYSDHGKGGHASEYCPRVEEPGADGKVRLTEKRLCRCLYYRNIGKCDCGGCLLEDRSLVPGEGWRVVDYEAPAFYYGKGIGEIDVVIDWEGKTYATEVKPPESKEPVLRMVAEIMTYTLGYPEGKYQRAIAFFAGSDQESEYKDLMEGNSDFCALLEKAKITVFRFKDRGGGRLELKCLSK